MELFNSQFYRSFVIGFALGAVALFVSVGSSDQAEMASRVIPSALAAPAE
jgi:hypothetical protein